MLSQKKTSSSPYVWRHAVMVVSDDEDIIRYHVESIQIQSSSFSNFDAPHEHKGEI